MSDFKSQRTKIFLPFLLLLLCFSAATAWVTTQPRTTRFLAVERNNRSSPSIPRVPVLLFSSSSSSTEEEKLTSTAQQQPDLPYDYEIPEDAVIIIKPKAMNRLRELRDKQKEGGDLILRMGVRSGGCSGMSYVMDFSTEDAIQEDDAVDEYANERIRCVVDAKSMLYLYGLELDYSDELIGGGFKFSNPNAEESCGCGSSFGV